ncbi:MAG TPA: YciI family protein [Gemmatimonadales bacterium]
MRYFTFVKGAENQGQPPQALLDAMGKFVEDSLKSGVLIQTGGLAQSRAGFRIRAEKGKLTVTDGPFTEAKEVVGGYALIEAPSRDAALKVATAFMRLHTDHWPEWTGESEVRPMDFLAP